MDKIVFIDNEPFTKRRDQLFYISRLRSEGYDVQVWDLSPFFPAARNVPDSIGADFVKTIGSEKRLENEILKVNRKVTCFIVESVLNKYSKPIFKLLKKYDCYTMRCNFYSNTLKGLSYKINNVVPWNFKILLKIIEQRCLYIYHWYKWRGLNVDIFLSPKNEYGKTGSINHPDYNDFKFKTEEPFLNYPYIVFCDQFFPYHPELINYLSQIDAHKYYIQMRKLFDFIEEKEGLPIIIAAHPKADYHNGEFGDRPIIKYKTNNLVVNAEKVIFHSSNSISYAVMSNKEILCVVTDDFKKVPFYSFLQGLSTELHIREFNIDKTALENIYFEKIASKLREKYIYSYLTSKETENRDNYSIIKETINNA